VNRFWDRVLVHIAFGDRIVRHCHRLAAQQFRLLLLSLTLCSLYGSIAVIQILSDVFQGTHPTGTALFDVDILGSV
jgi:hypothetical protein